MASDQAASCLPHPTPVNTVVTSAAPPPPTAPVAIDDIPARLTVIDRDLDAAAARLAAQRITATSAFTAAQGAAAGSPAFAAAELARTGLDRIGNQLGDIRDRLDAIAGTLAAASAAGTAVATPLLTTGRLIARTTMLQSDYQADAAALH